MWRKILQIPPLERKLLFRALVRVASLRLALSLLPWTVIRPRIGTLRAERRPGSHGPTIGQIAWAVEAASRRVPWGANCLVKALAAHTLLQEHGHPATIHIGVRGGTDSGFGAHAWVSSGGEAVIGRTAESYTALETLRL